MRCREADATAFFGRGGRGGVGRRGEEKREEDEAHLRALGEGGYDNLECLRSCAETLQAPPLLLHTSRTIRFRNSLHLFAISPCRRSQYYSRYSSNSMERLGETCRSSFKGGGTTVHGITLSEVKAHTTGGTTTRSKSLASLSHHLSPNYSGKFNDSEPHIRTRLAFPCIWSGEETESEKPHDGQPLHERAFPQQFSLLERGVLVPRAI